MRSIVVAMTHDFCKNRVKANMLWIVFQNSPHIPQILNSFLACPSLIKCGIWRSFFTRQSSISLYTKLDQILYYFVTSNNKFHWSLWISLFFFPFDLSFNFIVNLPSWLQKIMAAEMRLLWDAQKELVKVASQKLEEISWIEVICMINIILTAYCHITPDLSSFGVQKILAQFTPYVAWREKVSKPQTLICFASITS